MKLSRSKSRIIGVQTGEVTINLMGGAALVRAKFALLSEGGTVGHFDKSGAWSEKTEELLRQLTESMELDALPILFEEPAEDASGAEPGEEPPQI